MNLTLHDILFYDNVIFGILEILLNFPTWAGKILEPQQESPPKVYLFITNEESFTPEPVSIPH